MADMYIKKLIDLHENWYPIVFRVADYESELQNFENKMGNPIWRTCILKN